MLNSENEAEGFALLDASFEAAATLLHSPWERDGARSRRWIIPAAFAIR